MNRLRSITVTVSALLLAGCAGSGGAPSRAPVAPSASAVPTSSTGASAEAPIVLEDAGVDTDLAPALYTSRLFQPKLVLELGPGWRRHDDITDRKLRLARADDGADVTIVSEVDFLQCGKSAVIAKPGSKQIVDGIAASTKLDTNEPEQVAVGTRPAWAIKLLGGGKPVPEADFERSNEFGCVLSFGDVPFPKESFWAVLTPDVASQLAFVDVDGHATMIRGRPGQSGLDAVSTVTLDLLGHLTLG